MTKRFFDKHDQYRAMSNYIDTLGVVEESRFDGHEFTKYETSDGRAVTVESWDVDTFCVTVT